MDLFPGIASRRRTPANAATDDRSDKRDSPYVNSIFQQPWWLDAVAPGKWGEAIIEHEGRVVARMPFVARGRPRFRVLTMPPLTQTLGPWIERSAASPARTASDEMRLLGELEALLPSANAFRQSFSPTMMNALPFCWKGYQLEVRYTLRLEGLGDEQALWDGLRGNIRREIRKARRRLRVRDDLGLDRFYHVWSKTFERQSKPVIASLDVLERLDAACEARGARSTLFAEDEAGRVHAVAYAVWDRHVAYNLLGGAEPQLRTSGASSLLMWESIMRARAVTDVFDFEGSMIQPVERFFRSFGASQTPYLLVSRADARAQAAFAMRSGWRVLRPRAR
jgi:hypothetical protein